MNLNQFFSTLSFEEVKDFGRNQKNRPISNAHCNDFYQILCNDAEKISSNVEENLCYGIIPIIVNGKTNHILDGQHRHAAYLKAIENGIIPKESKIMVGFWNCNEEDEDYVIQMLNTKSKNWTLNDFIECYCKSNNEGFLRLKEFAKNHELCYNTKRDQCFYRYAAAMIKGSGQATNMKKGIFEATDEEFERGNKVHDELLALRKWLKIENNDAGIEPMACQWIKFKDKGLTLKRAFKVPLTKKLLTMPKTNKSNWEDVFNYLFAKSA